jgi:hypothetical protein
MKDYTKGKSPEMLEPFFPNEIFRYITVGCFLVIVELVSVMLFPLPCKLLNKPDHIPWFLLPVYKLKKLIHNEALFISILVLGAFLFVSWPFLVSSRKRNLLSPDNTHDTYGSRACHTKGHYLWQMPIPFIVVVVVIIFVITLCFINP